MQKVLITGSTGMVGGLVLKECLYSDEIEKVISFVRKPTGIYNDKLHEVVISNFKDYSKKTAFLNKM